MATRRRHSKRCWPRAAALALSLAGGCLSGAAPPSVPPGWTVHFQQDTPYFYNEKTGETTWEQPRPTTAITSDATTAAATPSAASAATPGYLAAAGTNDQLAPSSSSARRDVSSQPPARGGRQPSSSAAGGGGARKRGWFGLRRQAARQQQQPQQQWQSRGAAPAGGRDASREERSQEQWQGAGDRGWGHSAGQGGGSRQGRLPDGAQAFGDEQQQQQQPPLGASNELAPRRDGARATGWGDEEAAAGAGVSEPPRAGSSSLGAEGLVGQASPAGVGPEGRDGVGVAAAAAAPPEDSSCARSDGVDGKGGGGAFEATDERQRRAGDQDQWWAGGSDIAPSAASTGADRAAERGTTGDGLAGQSEGGGRAGKHNGETSGTEETIAAEKGGAAAAAPSAAATADGTADEWFLLSQEPQEPQTREGRPAGNAAPEHPASSSPPAWEGHDGDGGVLPGGGGPDRYVGTAAGSTSAGGTNGQSPSPVEQNVGLWGSGSRSQHEQQQQQRQQQQYGYDGMGHGDADWDWADPWGQGASWGAPAWAPGAESTPDNQPGGSTPPAPSPTSKEELDGGHAIGSVPDGTGVAGSGWGRHHSGGGERPGVASTVAAGAASVASADGAALGAGGEATAATAAAAAAAAEKGAARKEGGVTELARALAEAATELEEARKVQAELRDALKEQEEGKAAALAAATAAEGKTEKAEAFALRQAESAKENATAAGQWLVSLGLEREELKGQLAAAQTNSTSLLEELSALKESAVEAELRANSSEAKLRMAMEDIEVLDEGLKLFMDGDGQPRQQSSRAGPLSWRRVSEAYLRPLLPSKLKAPTPEELEALKLNRSLGRALENNTALAEAVSSKDDLVKELNSRIKQFQLHAVRRKKGYRALKLGLAELTNEVQGKETMMTILTVCMLGTSSILEGMDATLDAQRANIAEIAEVLRDREGRVEELTVEVQDGAACLTDLQTSLHKTESALSAVAVSLGAEEECVQRWKDAAAAAALGSPARGEEAGDDEDDGGPLAQLLHEIHTAAAKMFVSPLGLEPSTGAITIAVPRPIDGGAGGGGGGGGAGVGGVGDRGTKSPGGFWAGVFDLLCCRRR